MAVSVSKRVHARLSCTYGVDVIKGRCVPKICTVCRVGVLGQLGRVHGCAEAADSGGTVAVKEFRSAFWVWWKCRERRRDSTEIRDVLM